MAYHGMLIGCGYVSKFHLDAWSDIDGVNMVAVVDLDEKKARKQAKAFRVRRYYTDYRAALEAEADKLDFVDIATPPETHREMVGEAARRGLQVLCQKPIAPALADLREMIDLCDRAGVTFMVNENQRFQPWYRHMKVLLGRGAIGQPYYANITSRWRGSLPVIRFDNQPYFADMPRLVVYELGIHHVDTLRYLLGEADSVCGQTHKASDEIAGEDVAVLMLHMGKVTAIVDVSWASIPPWDTESAVTWGEARVEGTHGTLYLRADGRLRLITDEKDESFTFPRDSITLGFQACQQHFIDCLRSGAAPETGGAESFKTMELVFGAYDAAAHNRIYRTGQDLERLE
jgi:predicted dehydrogenase